MFTHLITLKKAPWFIYSQSQEDAINIVKRYKEHVVGVVLAPQGLLMQEVHEEITLTSPKPKLLKYIVENENERIAEEVTNGDSKDVNSGNKKPVQEESPAKA